MAQVLRLGYEYVCALLMIVLLHCSCVVDTQPCSHSVNDHNVEFMCEPVNYTRNGKQFKNVIVLCEDDLTCTTAAHELNVGINRLLGSLLGGAAIIAFECAIDGNLQATNEFCGEQDTSLLVSALAITMETSEDDFYCSTTTNRLYAENCSATISHLNGLYITKAQESPPKYEAEAAIISVSVVTLMLCLILAYTLQRTRKAKDLTLKQLEGQELLLTQYSEKNARLSAVWQIPEEHLMFKSKIAEGAFGVVWKGSWEGLPVAIKKLKMEINDEFYGVEEDYKREYETLQSIRHPNLLIFYGAGVSMDDNRPFLVTEFMVRGSLRSILSSDEALSWEQKQSIALDIARGMAHLHKLQIIHRDLKSDNCLCDSVFNTKVADFGTSRILDANEKSLTVVEPQMRSLRDASMTSHPSNRQSYLRDERDEDKTSSSIAASKTMTKGVGTILWMAPELFVGGTKYGYKVDVYSYSIILYELVTRLLPWSELDNDSLGYLEFFEMINTALLQHQRPHIDSTLETNHTEFVSLIKRCWSSYIQNRPEFVEIVAELQDLTRV